MNLKVENFNLRSEEVQDILTAMPRWYIKWGNLIITLILSMVLLFSFIIKYPEIITSDVVITTSNPPEKLIAKTSGKFQKIFINNNAFVTKGTVIAVLENSANYEDVFRLKQTLESIDFKKPSLQFASSDATYASLGELESSYSLFEKDYISYILYLNLKPHKVETGAQKIEYAELHDRLELLNQQKIISGNELDLKKKDLSRYQKLFDKGVISAQEWDLKNMEYLQLERNLKSITSSISQLRSSLNDLDRTIHTTYIKETSDNITLLKNSVQSFNQLLRALNEWELKYIFRSSISGQVSYLNFWNENQTVNTGDNVFNIVPDGKSQYIGKAKATAVKSGKIKVGQQVNIKLRNYPDQEYGVLKGKVANISNTPDKEGYILLDISLPDKLITSYDKTVQFHQEMVGTADIITEDLMLIERFFYKFKELFNRG